MKFLSLFILSLFHLSLAHAETKTEGLSNESGLGMVLTSGNTSVATINVSQFNSYLQGQNEYKFNAFYLRSSNKGVEQALMWGLGLRYERELKNRFNVFVSQMLMSDTYQGIVQRYNTDLGGKYFFEKTERLSWFMELGYRFTRENYSSGFRNLNFVRAYHEIEKKIDKDFSAKWWIEYLPNIVDWQAYQANTEVSLAMLLSEIFSLKSAYAVRYYNVPPAGIENRTDQTFTTSLVAKF